MIQASKVQDQEIDNLRASLTIVRQTIVDLGKNITDQNKTITDLTNLIHDAHEREAVLEERVTHGLPDARGR